MASYFVTSTGTDVGKTFVTSGLIRYLRESNQPVAALKPVVSGYDSSVVETSDPAVLLSALGRPAHRRRNRTHRTLAFPRPACRPISPPRAKAAASTSTNWFHSAATRSMRRKGRCLSKVWAGSWCRSTRRRTVLDWMAALDIPLLLVVGGYLGTISHTLTALDVLAQRKLTIAAIVVSESERDTVELDDTVDKHLAFCRCRVGVVGLPRLPAGINHHPAIARIAALL